MSEESGSAADSKEGCKTDSAHVDSEQTSSVTFQLLQSINQES